MSHQGAHIGGPAAPATRIRRRLRISGRVQGVGFRPTIFRLATSLGLTGHVGNDSHGAFVEIEGAVDRINSFLNDLPSVVRAPAHIERCDVCDVPVQNDSDFSITVSREAVAQDAEITPDLATCPDCLRELQDPQDRRRTYGLINCIHCGPRYSIISRVPYDRPNTTMASFAMCPSCQAEYDAPADRRFHAQPNACPECGPRLWFLDRERSEVEGSPIRVAARWIADGAVIAVKGIGGFHLACLAEDDRAVALLRLRKHRDAKPFAIMVPTLEIARAVGVIDEVAARLLSGPERPIVLVPKRADHRISEIVAPGVSCFGIMLPYTPIHHLLFAEGVSPLVMTSANQSDEPLCFENEEALERLAHIADGFLLHNRPIQRRVDDSVILSTGTDRAPVVPLRRSRGYVPEPIMLTASAPQPVLALGGDLKSTICIASDRQAVLSEHFGDLSNPVAYRNYLTGIPHLSGLLKVSPSVIAHDLHPDYHSTRYAQWESRQRIGVQHHHAHIVSCMADNGITGPVVGIACDGTGYGTDGAIWGCEVMVCDEADFTRAAHLRYYRLIGGDAAATETWRPAVSLLREAFGRDWREHLPARRLAHPPDGLDLAEERLNHAHNIPQTSSLGRLFDAAAWILGVCSTNRYEAEAAMALEKVATGAPSCDPLPFELDEPAEGPMQLDVRPMIRATVLRLKAGEPVPQLAGAIHECVARILVQSALLVSERTAIARVVLSGGCFANRILLDRVIRGLSSAGREPLVHRQVPPGDGGISLGQAVIAAAKLRRS